MAELPQVLEWTVSPDNAQRQEAQTFLKQAETQSLPQFLFALAQVLGNNAASPIARSAAGLYLKNCLHSKDESTNLQLQQRWLQIDPQARIEIKKVVVNTLGTEPTSPSTAAQCVAAIACAELPVNQWPNAIEGLVHHVTSEQAVEKLKEASLDAIGYICEDIEPRLLSAKSNVILTAIMHGMRKEEPSLRVRLSGTKALCNALEFTSANFEKENERHYIMQVVCEATQCAEEPRIRVAALQNLVRIMSLYYQYMESYMGPALFAITLGAMKSENEEESLQGIEFWSTVCDEEIDLSMEALEAEEQNRMPEQVSRYYTKGALPYLVPIILATLAKQDEYDDEDQWTPSKAAGVCLMLISSCVCNDIIVHVQEFIKENIAKPDWKLRDAAAFTLGAVVEGPDTPQVEPVVKAFLEVLIQLMKDQVVQVRDTAAWSLGRICQIMQDTVVNANVLQPLLGALVDGLAMEPRVATNACWALSSLAEAAYESADIPQNSEDEEPPTYALSTSFAVILEKLILTADRQDGNRSNLRNAAYEALGELIKYSPRDCYETVRKTAMVTLERLDRVLQLDTQASLSVDRTQLNDLASLLCATTQSLLRKVTKDDSLVIAEMVMKMMLTMLNSSVGKTGGVQDDAISTVGVVIQVIGSSFMNYLEAFKPFLLQGLKKIDEYQVCITTVGVVGDLCRALEKDFVPLMNDVMQIMLENLSNPQCHRRVKPHILSAVGDVALATGQAFKPQLELVLKILQEAANAQVDRSDYDMLVYLTTLRDGCLEAYTGIIQGLKGDGETLQQADAQLLAPHVQFIAQFLAKIAGDEERSEDNIASSAGLIGDVCAAYGAAYGAPVKAVLNLPPIVEMLESGKRSGVDRTSSLCSWALSKLDPYTH